MRKIVLLLLSLLFLIVSADAQTTSSKNKKKKPRITAKAWLIADSNGKILKGSNVEDVHSIASVTKLMTAIVVLDAKQKLDEKITSSTRRQEMQIALVHSVNHAADNLCNSYPGGYEACIKAMNVKALKLKMLNTSFKDATGLSEENVSTASDLIKLVAAAQYYPEIVKAAQTQTVKIQIRKRWFIFRNTNPIIGRKYKFIVSKTGFTQAAGGCIVLMIDSEVGKRIIVVLGSKNAHTRVPEAEFIIKSAKLN